VSGNHRPDIAWQWSEGEIALRCCRIFPRYDRATGEPVEPDEHDPAMVMADSERLAELRKRLHTLDVYGGRLPQDLVAVFAKSPSD